MSVRGAASVTVSVWLGWMVRTFDEEDREQRCETGIRHTERQMLVRVETDGETRREAVYAHDEACPL